MKNTYFLLAASLWIVSCGPTTVIQSDHYQPAPAPAPVMDVSYQSFYDQLSPYGNWINYPGYGYVWMPNTGPGFRPYGTNGNWIYTDAGWTWASNYNWGWAPFHYGRWFYENGYGWMWVPGNEWAPAWVSWRGNGDYYGWAPLGPRISVDVALSNYNPPVYYWNFVPRQYMGNPGWHNYHVDESRNLTIINNTTIISNYSGSDRSRYAYAPGPDPNEVRRVSGNHFKPAQIREASSPGERVSGSQYVIYHPRVSATPAARGDAAGRPSTPAPARYEPYNNLRPSSQYPSYNQENNNPARANNPRPDRQSSGYNQPSGDPRPQSEADQQTNHNRPAENYRPAEQSPGNMQPASIPGPVVQSQANHQPNNNRPAENYRPAEQSPGNMQPASIPGPVVQSQANHQPNNNPPDEHHNGLNQPEPNHQPVNNPRHQDPVNNTGSNGQNAVAEQHSAPSNQPASLHTSDPRRNQLSHAHGNARPAQTPPQNNAQPPTSPDRHEQTTGRPSSDHNPHNGQPEQRASKPDNQPEQRSTEKPKTREANDN